jgi:hypothetical protein
MNITIARGTAEDGIADVAWCDVFGNVSDFTPYHSAGHTVEQAFEYVKASARSWTHTALKLDESGEPILQLITNGPDFAIVAEEVIHEHRINYISVNDRFCVDCEHSGSIHDLAAIPCEPK